MSSCCFSDDASERGRRRHAHVGSGRQSGRELGLDGRSVFFNRAWVPYDERLEWFAEADIGVSAHPESFEARLAFRTRLLDHIAAGTPLVVTRGDVLADLVEARGMGRVVAPGDVDGWTAALASCSTTIAPTQRQGRSQGRPGGAFVEPGRRAARGAARAGRLVSPAAVARQRRAPRVRPRRCARSSLERTAFVRPLPPPRERSPAAAGARVSAVVTDERPVSVRGGGYDLKDASYFAMARDDYVDALPATTRRRSSRSAARMGRRGRWLSRAASADATAASSSFPSRRPRRASG